MRITTQTRLDIHVSNYSGIRVVMQLINIRNMQIKLLTMITIQIGSINCRLLEYLINCIEWFTIVETLLQMKLY